MGESCKSAGPSIAPCGAGTCVKAFCSWWHDEEKMCAVLSLAKSEKAVAVNLEHIMKILKGKN